MITSFNQDTMIVRLLPDRRAFKEIHYDNLDWNYRLLKGLLPEGCTFMAVVKADAYGHGAVPVAAYLNRAGVRAFAVATVREGMELRQNGIQGEILVLGYTPPEEVTLLTAWDLIQTAVDAAHAEALACASLSPVKIHLKIDTGMHRIGQPMNRLDELLPLFSNPNVQILGMFSHLCVADSKEPEDIAFTREQITEFYEAAAYLRSRGVNPGKLHLQSSYGLLNYPGLSLDYARIGIALYGAFSAPDEEFAARYPLRPVLSLHAKVSLVKELRPGESVSYGRNFRADRPMRIAAVTIGYADGLPRALSGKDLPVLVRGALTRVIGNICMDQLLIDVTHIPVVRPGERVTILGTDGSHTLRAENLAQKAGTISNEILCRLNVRET